MNTLVGADTTTTTIETIQEFKWSQLLRIAKNRKKKNWSHHKFHKLIKMKFEENRFNNKWEICKLKKETQANTVMKITMRVMMSTMMKMIQFQKQKMHQRITVRSLEVQKLNKSSYGSGRKNKKRSNIHTLRKIKKMRVIPQILKIKMTMKKIILKVITQTHNIILNPRKMRMIKKKLKATQTKIPHQ